MPPRKSLQKKYMEKEQAVSRGPGNHKAPQRVHQRESVSPIPIQYIASMLDNAQEAIVVMQDEVHKYVNRRASVIDGRSVEELIGKHMREMTHPEDYKIAFKSYKKKLAGKPVDKYRYRGINKNGQILWLEIIGTAILWEGRPAVLNFVADVTKQVEAEEALKKSEHMLSDIINFLPEATFAIDMEGKIILWNREMEKMMGVKAADMLGKDHYEYSLPFYGKRMPMLIDMVRNPQKRTVGRYTALKKEKNFFYAEHSFQLKGETRWLWCKASPIYDHKSRLVGAIEAMQDVTDFRKAVAELKNKSQHLEEANTALKVLLEHRKNDRSEIEEKIADLVKEGKSAKEISQILNIAVHTANNYRKRLRKKFSLQNKNKNLRVHLLSFK